MLHELFGLVVNFIGVDEHFADIRAEIIANGANNKAAFLVNQECAVGRFPGSVDGSPELQQVI